MIYSLRGKLIYADPLSSTAVIECAGVGYRATVTANTYRSLPPVDGDVFILTHMQVREDGVELYGFMTEDELDTFRMLLSVSGVGPKAAMSVLSLFTPEKLAFTVSAEDAKSIARAPGVGAKTAARIVLELKDKLAKAFPDAGAKDMFPSESGKAAPRGGAKSTKLSDARDALTVLGYSSSEVAAALKNADMSAPLEDIIKAALASLMAR